MPRWSSTNQDDWMLVLSFDVSRAMRGLSDYRAFMKKKSSSAKNKQNKKWALEESKSATKIMDSIRNVKTKGPVFEALQYAGNRLYNSVLATWRAELEPHTYRYLNAIKMSPIDRTGDIMFVGVGNWKHLMQATSISERAIQYSPIESWIRPKYGMSDTLRGASISASSKKSGGLKSGSYIASRGPLIGEEITGYWYFLEAGFYHHISQKFVHRPVFSEQDMGHFHELAYHKFDNKLRALLTKAGGWAKWGSV